MKRLSLLLVFATLLIAVSGCAQEQQQTGGQSGQNASGGNQNGSGGGQVFSSKVIVSARNFAFDPQIVKIKAGSTVVWVNDDPAPHQVVSDARGTLGVGDIFNSEILESGEKYSFVFSEVGEFQYYCHLHPNMRGIVIVEK